MKVRLNLFSSFSVLSSKRGFHHGSEDIIQDILSFSFVFVFCFLSICLSVCLLFQSSYHMLRLPVLSVYFFMSVCLSVTCLGLLSVSWQKKSPVNVYIYIHFICCPLCSVLGNSCRAFPSLWFLSIPDNFGVYHVV